MTAKAPGVPESLVRALESVDILQCGTCQSFGVLGVGWHAEPPACAEVWRFEPAIGGRPGRICGGCVERELQGISEETLDAREFRGRVASMGVRHAGLSAA